MTTIEKAYAIRNKYNAWAVYDKKVKMLTERINKMNGLLIKLASWEGTRKQDAEIYFMGYTVNAKWLKEHIDQDHELLARATENLRRVYDELTQLMGMEAG